LVQGLVGDAKINQLHHPSAPAIGDLVWIPALWKHLT